MRFLCFNNIKNQNKVIAQWLTPSLQLRQGKALDTLFVKSRMDRPRYFFNRNPKFILYSV